MSQARRSGYDNVNVKIGANAADADEEEVSVAAPDVSHLDAYDAARGIKTILCSLFWTVYVPTLLLSLGNSVTYPTLPLYAQSLGLVGVRLGLPLAGVSLGRFATNVLSGKLLSYFGIRATMVLSFVVSAIAAFFASCSEGFWSLTGSIMLLGFGASLEAMGRMTYCKIVVSNEHRGRVVAALGGTMRIGAIFGPAVGGIVAQGYGFRAPFSVQFPIYTVAAITCAISIPSNSALGTDTSKEPPVARVISGLAVAESRGTVDSASYRSVWQCHWRLLLNVGGAMFFLQFIRGARIMLIPIYGSEIALGVDQIGFAVTVSFIMDSILFPLVGPISDTYGRKCLGTPAFVLLTFGIFMLCFSNTFSLLLLAALIAGLGNGFSSGLIMTTGVDVAPPHPETPLFLGLYGGFYDSGESLAPILIGALAKISDFQAAGLIAAALGLLGIPWYIFCVPESRENLKQAPCMRYYARRKASVAVRESAPVAAANVLGRIAKNEVEVQKLERPPKLTG